MHPCYFWLVNGNDNSTSLIYMYVFLVKFLNTYYHRSAPCKSMFHNHHKYASCYHSVSIHAHNGRWQWSQVSIHQCTLFHRVYVATWDTFLKIIKNNNYISRLSQYPFVGHKK